MFIYESYPNGLPSADNYKCRINWLANTVYRELPASTTSTMASFETLAQSSSSSPMTRATSSPAPASTMPPEEKKLKAQGRSKAWIAGPVVGGVVLVGDGIALFFLISRRQKRKEAEQLGAGSGPSMDENYKRTQVHFHELQQPLPELMSVPERAQELPTESTRV
ncbi:hypothetical protein GQ43DRAFT_487484 [Delitschia confertaspora ATCC 74209]|uniref:Uncharacterized protein n=1 Tax=Delitschia confertaspora ATCC 74209 TaxID=1513339 RepID=A0A9P4MSU3_9PLEO|nr:hypothetical protein GQ43DRAFT_487484 [Delitschia confertaspora ATCC 74209]